MYKKEKELKLIFLGNSDFSSLVLLELLKSEFKPSLIIMGKDKPSGRNNLISFSSLKKIAIDKKIKFYQPEKINDIFLEIKNFNPDIAIVASYGQKIPLEILNIPKYGFINIHPSLLPFYRGPSPIREAIKNNDNYSGTTIMLMNEKIDGGPIIAQEKIILKKGTIYLDLSRELALQGSKLLIKIIPKWVSGKIEVKKQNDNYASYTKIITKKDGLISWSLSALEIEAMVRFLNPWPGTYSFYKDKKTDKKKMIKILGANVQKETETGPFGPLGKVYMATNNQLAVKAGKDFLIITKLQLENKKPVNVEDFLNGNIDFIGTILF